MPSKPAFIPSIYNYCDRWCERCSLTFACSVYAPPEELPDLLHEKSNTAFWDKLARNFEKTITLLKKDVLFSSTAEAEVLYTDQKGLSMLTEQHPLSQLCRRYAVKASQTLNNESLLNSTCAELIQEAELGIKGEEQILDKIQILRECKEVISWYLFFIAAKMGRALMSKIEGWEDAATVQTDMNGSVKIALIGIERSMQAWVQISHITQEEDQIYPLLQMLSIIKNQAKEVFPRAEEFVRPGFDEQRNIES